MLVTFGLWNWVDGHLDKQPWLSDKANTSGTSWLILGSDQRTGEEAKTITGFRTDTILVLTKPNSGTRSLISIPRDSLVQVNGTYMKINAVAQLSGEKALVQQVETITGQKIDHVAQIKFNGLKDVVDALGGSTCAMRPDRERRPVQSQLTAGCQLPMGRPPWRSHACATPTRRAISYRAERQRQVIGAIAKKAMSGKTLTNIPKLNKTLKAALASITVDSKTNPYTLAQMVFAVPRRHLRQRHQRQRLLDESRLTCPGRLVGAAG